jgi:predicted permease
MFGELFAIIAPLFVGAGIGYVWGRLDRPYDADLITSLVFLFGTPCLVFSTLTKLEVDPAALGEIALAAAAALITFMIVGGVILRLAGLPYHSYLPALTFPNAGSAGLPLCLFAFGDVGLALAIAYFAVTSTSQFTIGMWIASGELSPRQLLGTPLLYAIAVALVFMLTGTEPPAWIANSARIVGGLTIPLMLITLGVSLARLRVTSFRRALAFSLLRLGLGIAVGLGLAYVFGLDGAARGVFILQCTMPVAVFNYLFAQRFRRAPHEVAGMVVLSTAITFASLPLLLLLVI